MVNPLIVAGVVYGVAELYQYLSPDIKQWWENLIKSHHGEWGAMGFIGGLLTNSPKMTATGAALMLHDRKDRSLWFQRNLSEERLSRVRR